jgi:ribosomal protein S18 acetylase RimI-like enzyme
MADISKAQESHVEAIGDLWWEFLLFHQDIESIFVLEEDSIQRFREDHLLPHMRSEDGLVLVALDGTRAVGFCISEVRRIIPGLKRPPYGYIDTIAVTAEYRRKGIGEKLYAETTKWLQSKEIGRLELGTDARNVAGNSFWRKMGFTVYHHEMCKDV